MEEKKLLSLDAGEALCGETESVSGAQALRSPVLTTHHSGKGVCHGMPS